MTMAFVTRRVAEIEDALAKSLDRGDFEIITDKGERYLAPILDGHVHPEAVWSRPMLALYDVAREVERLLS